MQLIKHHLFDSEQELAKAAASELIRHLQQSKGEVFTIALSGGRIAIPFYEAIVKQSAEAKVSWEKVHFFWADERCVPSDSAESNYRGAYVSLFHPLQTSNENIHRIYGETEESYAVSQAEAELCRICPLDAEGMPIVDLVILGMGEDGHTASLFPAEPMEMVNDLEVFRAVTATKPPPQRITMGYQVVIRAKEAIVLATGAGKKQILERVLGGDETLPLARIIDRRPITQFYTFLT